MEVRFKDIEIKELDAVSSVPIPRVHIEISGSPDDAGRARSERLDRLRIGAVKESGEPLDEPDHGLSASLRVILKPSGQKADN